MNEKWIDIAMEEYKTLREESLAAIAGQQQVLIVGLGGIGVLLGVGAASWNDSDKNSLAAIVLLALIPLLCYLMLIIWIGEVIRMRRAGNFIAGIEQRINAAFPSRKDVLSWETRFRQPLPKNNIKLSKNYQAIICLFLLTALLSIALGDTLIFEIVSGCAFVCLNVAELLFFGATTYYLYRTGFRLNRN
jgi:hypothetical protein